MNEAPLVIRLDQLDSPQQFQTVHQQALRRLVEQVDAGLQRTRQQLKLATNGNGQAKPWLDSLQPLDQGHTSFIDGTRGAGKTTFLRVACRALCKELQTGAEPPPPAVAQSTLCLLGLMDPSRVENGENILLNVVRAVQRRVDDCTPCFGERARQDAAQQFNATLEKLTTGLGLLRKEHDPLKDVVDPEVFVSLQLERVDEGEQLRSTFHTLLAHACQVLKADALVLAFDDADTSAHKGSELMECLRKYLNSPQLVVLVAGDMELYAQLARNLMVKNVGEKVKGAKPERQDQHHRMLDHLEEQYLLKVFPVQRRFQLLPLKNVDQAEGPIQLQWPSRTVTTADASVQPQTATLSALLTFTLQHGLLVKDTKELMPYRDYVLSWPIRSILQVMARCTPLLVVEAGQIKLRGPAADAKDVFALLQAFQRTFTEAVRSACLGGLYAHGVDVDAIAQDHFPALIKAVVDVVLEQGNLDTGAYLRPTSTSESLNACFFALSAEVARLCMGRPDRAIAYMLMGPGTVSAFQMTQQVSKAIPSASVPGAQRAANSRGIHHHQLQVRPTEATLHAHRQPNLDEFKRYMRVGFDDDVVAWSWRVAPLFFQPITKEQWKALLASSTDLSIQSEIATDFQTVLARLCVHHIQVSQSDDVLVWSGWTALSLLSALWAVEFDLVTSGSGEHSEFKEAVKGIARKAEIRSKVFRILQRTATPHSTGIPPWQSGSGQSLLLPPLKWPSYLVSLADYVCRWLEQVENSGHDGVLASAAMLGSVWARLYFNRSAFFESGGLVRESNLLWDFHHAMTGRPGLGDVVVAETSNQEWSAPDFQQLHSGFPFLGVIPDVNSTGSESE